jgi:DNA-binding transcriptional LysR family regulator
MDPHKKLVDLWNRLPVFRVVAATEHLPTASQQLHVTAPAISRTIRLLEEELGQPLFRRSGRSLVLNAAGKRLVRSLSDAMTALEGTLSELASDPLAGPVRVSTIGVLTDYFVLPAVFDLMERHPELKPSLLLHGTSQANDLLARGRLDVAFYYEALTDERLEIERLGETGASVFCGAGHPLFDASDLTLEEILEHPFSVPQAGDTGQVMDGWPVDLPRKIGMRITMLHTNLSVCLSGRFITVLPDVVAREHLATGRLRRFPYDLIDPIPVYAARRRSDGPGTAADAVVHAVQQRLIGKASPS